MRLSISILILAICSSLVFAQNEENSQKSSMINILEPTFIGTNGSIGFNEFIQENLLLPVNSQNNGIEGAVVVQFNVSPTGSLSDFQVIESLFPAFDQSVISTLEATNGMWNPGLINGCPVIMNKEAVFVFKYEGTNIFQAAQTNINKADGLLKEGKYSRAVKLYSKALGSCPNSDLIIYRRGLARYYAGNLEGALNDFNRVAYLDSHLADPILTKLNEVAEYANRELK